MSDVTIFSVKKPCQLNLNITKRFQKEISRIKHTFLQ